MSLEIWEASLFIGILAGHVSYRFPALITWCNSLKDQTNKKCRERGSIHKRIATAGIHIKGTETFGLSALNRTGAFCTPAALVCLCASRGFLCFNYQPSSAWQKKETPNWRRGNWTIPLTFLSVHFWMRLTWAYSIQQIGFESSCTGNRGGNMIICI